MIAAINAATRLQGFLSENILRAAKPHQIKIRTPGNCLTTQHQAQRQTKEKARRCRAFFGECLFRLVHFASLAI